MKKLLNDNNNMMIKTSKNITMVRYVIDITICHMKGLILRLDSMDVLTLFLILAFFLVAITGAIMFHWTVFLIYTVVGCMIFIEFIKFREKNLYPTSLSPVTVETQIFDHPLSIVTIVGSWKGKRGYMEDENIVCSTNGLFGVIDGHGGNDVAKYIKNNFAHVFDDTLHCLINNNHDNQNMDSIVLKSLKHTMYDMDFDSYDNTMHGGAVCSFIKISSDRIYCACVGDTEAYVIMEDNAIHKITENHSISEFNEYQRYTDNLLNMNVRRSNVLRTHTGLIPTRTIGDHKHKKRNPLILVEPIVKILREVYTEQNDKQNRKLWKCVILATDGVWDSMNIDNLRNIINFKLKMIDLSSDTDITNIANNIMLEIQKRTTKKADIIDKITGRYHGDNCTLMIIMNKNLLF